MEIMLSTEKVILPESAAIATPPPSPVPKSFNEVVCSALDNPLDCKPLNQWDFNGKTVAIIIDDWGRPTPCHEFLPSVLSRIKNAKDITIVMASGMHDPMSEEDIARKVGKDIMCAYRCISHDAGDEANLDFIGITDLGTPVWINRYVARADIRLSFGRIYPHGNYGYEGGYKMIVPGVASFETIVRDHSLNFSPFSDYGILKNNPSRNEAEAIGRMVGIDFSVSFVMNYNDQPITAFGGSVETVFPTGVNFGQRYVWGAVCGKRSDITILCSSSMADLRLSNNPTYYIGLAMSVTKPDGIVIAKIEHKPHPKRIIEGYDLDLIPFETLCRLHEKRNWNMSPRQVQHILKTIRGVFYARRIFEYRTQKLYLVASNYPYALLEQWGAKQFSTILEAYDAACAEKQSPEVLVIPDGEHTLPLIDYDFPQ